MAGNSIAEDIDSSFTAVPAVSQELLPSQEADDIFLTIQRASYAVSKIYNDLFAKSRADFVSELSELCCTSELRFVRDMMAAVVKRKLGQCNIGNLIERRGTNVKDNLLKDTYDLYLWGRNQSRLCRRTCYVVTIDYKIRRFRLTVVSAVRYLPLKQMSRT